MKNLKYSLACIILLASCNKDLDDQNISLNGKWVLTDRQCFCGSPEASLTNNILTFNSKNGTAIFENNVDPEDNGYFLGAYNFSIVNDSLKFTGSFDFEPSKSSGLLVSIYSIQGNTLILDFDPLPRFVDDELRLIYEKL